MRIFFRSFKSFYRADRVGTPVPSVLVHVQVHTHSTCTYSELCIWIFVIVFVPLSRGHGVTETYCDRHTD